MSRRCQPSQPLLGSMLNDALAGFHLRRLLNGGKGVRLQLEQSHAETHIRRCTQSRRMLG